MTNNTPKHTIICVDDEIDNIDALERIFRLKFTVLKSTSGQQALELLDNYPEQVAVIITDQRMPQMSGVEFLSKTLEKRPDAVRILLTGYTDMESIIAAVNSGQIFRYINKPWDPVDLMNTVERAIERFELQQELKVKNLALEKALAELQTLDQAKDQFMILINHELKTPLTSIISFSELLTETSLTEEQTLCLQKIDRGAQRLKNLVDDSLLIISAESKTLKPKIQTFNAQFLLQSVNPELDKNINNKHQILKKEIADKKIIADQNLIQLVLERILHNASKFGREGSEIIISTNLSQPHRLKFTISNQGPQISNKVIDKILKPFFIDEDVMNHSVGTGLGLTVSQSILRSHGSNLTINNNLSGVEVSFEIPCL